jgi:hypothetical protein
MLKEAFLKNFFKALNFPARAGNKVDDVAEKAIKSFENKADEIVEKGMKLEVGANPELQAFVQSEIKKQMPYAIGTALGSAALGGAAAGATAAGVNKALQNSKEEKGADSGNRNEINYGAGPSGSFRAGLERSLYGS